jgi:hypothetical protein
MAVAYDLGDAGNTQFGMCHSRYKEEISTRLSLAAVRLIYTASNGTHITNGTNITSGGAQQQPGPSNTSPVVTKAVSVHAKDYRTYVIALNVSFAGESIVINGTKQVRTIPPLRLRLLLLLLLLLLRYSCSAFHADPSSSSSGCAITLIFVGDRQGSR